MILSFIVAMDLENGIGKNNGLPWRLPSDLKRFKSLTMGHHLIMGRKTYESIGRPLPGRISIVITRNPEALQKVNEGQTAQIPLPLTDLRAPLVFVSSLDQALQSAQINDEDEVFIIGGGEVFRLALAKVDRIYLTTVQAHLDCDTFFPNIDPTSFIVLSKSDISQNEGDQYPSQYQLLQRIAR